MTPPHRNRKGGVLTRTTDRENLEKAVFKKEEKRPENSREARRKERRSGTKERDTERQKGVRDPPPKGQVVPAQGCMFSCRRALVRVH